MSDIIRIDEAMNFDISDAKNAVDDNITIMDTRESELREFADHVRSTAENIEDAKIGYTRVMKLLGQLEEAIEDVDGEAEGAMSDANNIDTSY